MPTTTVLAASNFLLPDATFIAELVAFLIILAVLWRYVVPPLQRSMNQRQELIRKQFADSQQARERLEAAEAEYRQALVETRADAARIRDEARAQGQQIINELTDKARAEAARISAQAETRLEVARQRMVQELRNEVGQLAVDLAGRIVGEALDDTARQSRVVDRFLADLEGRQVEPAAAPSGASAGAGAPTAPAGSPAGD